MTALQDLPELVLAAQDTAKASQDRMAQILKTADGQELSEPQAEQMTSETIAIELAAVDIFAVFEARMQGHFKRGPLSRKVKAALMDAGQADLADRLHQHYLAVNVLKHGTGASYRELLNNKSTLIIVKDAADVVTNGEGVSTGLVDVTAPQFFDGLTQAILDAYAFLEKK